MSRARTGTLALTTLITAVVLMISTAAASAASDFTWAGAGTSATWSTAANWAGGTAPSGSVGTLSFPQLTGSGCGTTSASGTCYTSTDDGTAATTADALSIDDTEPYAIAGGPGISLGKDGLKAVADSSTTYLTQAPTLGDPIALTAPQTWSIDGGDNNFGGLQLNGAVSGNQALAIDFTNYGFLQLSANVGAITATGAGSLTVASGSTGGSLNGTDGNAVTLTGGVGLSVPYTNSSVGALTQTGGYLNIGSGIAPEPDLAVNGALSFASDPTAGDVQLYMSIDQPGTAAGSYGEITATGNINLAGATLNLTQGAKADGSCVDLSTGDAETLVSTSGGTITGTFDGQANPSTIDIQNYCDGAATDATALLTYTPTSVVATITGGGAAGDVPQNSVAPTISGTPAVGQTLTAVNGTWSGGPTFTYQWFACPDANDCTTIIGATKSTYVPTAAQQGDLIEVDVTATNSSGSNDAASKPTTAVGPQLPTNTAVPTISGTASVGSTLAAATGTWLGSPTSYSYQWYRCGAAGSNCAPINNATTSTYLLAGADAGHTLVVAVTARNATGSGGPVNSGASPAVTAAPVVQPAAPTLVTRSVISGNPVVGQLLTATAPQFGGGAGGTGYAWEDCRTSATTSCTKIAGATKLTYRARASDVGRRLRVLVGSINKAGEVTGYSGATAAVLSATAVKAGLAPLSTIRAQRGVRYRAPASGLLTVTWTGKLGHRSVVLATFKKSLAKPGTVAVKLKLTPAGAKLIKRLARTHTHARVTSTVSYRLPGARAITRAGALQLKS